MKRLRSYGRKTCRCHLALSVVREILVLCIPHPLLCFLFFLLSPISPISPISFNTLFLLHHLHSFRMVSHSVCEVRGGVVCIPSNGWFQVFFSVQEVDRIHQQAPWNLSLPPIVQRWQPRPRWDSVSKWSTPSSLRPSSTWPLYYGLTDWWLKFGFSKNLYQRGCKRN